MMPIGSHFLFINQLFAIGAVTLSAFVDALALMRSQAGSARIPEFVLHRHTSPLDECVGTFDWDIAASRVIQYPVRNRVHSRVTRRE